MEITETLYVTSRDDWRAWLAKNHDSKKEVWLIYFKKHTGKPSVPYEDAVEEALCFGWIDTTVKRVDDEKYVQKYTPRNENSIWSKSNRERAEKMIEQDKMTEVGLKKIEAAKKSGEWTNAYVAEPDPEMSLDLRQALSKSKKAEKNFNGFAPSHRKMYVWWITSAKREETRRKRIEETVKRAAENKKLYTM